MPRLALGLAYDGTAFHGWQRQRGIATLQETLETAASSVANQTVQVTAAGRTDAGVHATGQVVVFSTDALRDDEQWRRGINALTPDALQVLWVRDVPDTFHARYSATARQYVYVYADRDGAAPFLINRVWRCEPLDADLMHRSARVLLGEHDFSGFRAAGCQSVTPMRRIDACVVRRTGDFVVLEIRANAFLLHMVRNIARCLHDASRQDDEALPATILDGLDRTQLGPTAPPGGLYLTRVNYGDVALPETPHPSFVTVSPTG